MNDDYHDHDNRYADLNHWHSGYESLIEGLREDLNRAQERIHDPEERLDRMMKP